MRIGIDGRSLLNRRTGIGRYTHEMTLSLIAQGLDVRVYAPRDLGDDVSDRIRRLSKSGSAHALSRQAWMQLQLPHRLLADDVDVFWGPAHRVPILLAPTIKAVVTVHDLVWKLYPETMHLRTYLGERFLMPPSVRRADAVVTDSTATAAAIAVSFPYTKRMEVIYPGVYSADLPKASSTLPRDFILFVGTLEPRKNLERLLRAYALLPDEVRSRHSLVIAGGQGWRQRDLLSLAKELGILPNVAFTGFISDEDIVDLYSRCLFLAFPSIYEGFGLPIIEANRYGKAVLTSRSSSMPEVGGAACYLVDPLDINSIASGLRVMIEDQQLRDQLETAAIPNAERFNWLESAAQLSKLFADLVNSR